MRRGIEDGTFNEADATYDLRDVYDWIQKEELIETIIPRTVQKQELSREMIRRNFPESLIDKNMDYLGGKKQKRKTRRKTRKNKKTKKKSK